MCSASMQQEISFLLLVQKNFRKEHYISPMKEGDHRNSPLKFSFHFFREKFQRAVPKCLFCFDNDVEVLFLPCAHAMCCEKCKENWMSRATNSADVKFLNKRPKVECPVCRREGKFIDHIL